jgi:hypothetical protein
MDRRTVDLKDTGDRFVFLRTRLLKCTFHGVAKQEGMDRKPLQRKPSHLETIPLFKKRNNSEQNEY